MIVGSIGQAAPARSAAQRSRRLTRSGGSQPWVSLPPDFVSTTRSASCRTPRHQDRYRDRHPVVRRADEIDVAIHIRSYICVNEIELTLPG